MRSLSRFSLVGISTCFGQAALSERGMASPGNSDTPTGELQESMRWRIDKMFEHGSGGGETEAVVWAGRKPNIDRVPTMEAPHFCGVTGRLILRHTSFSEGRIRAAD